MPPPWVGFRQSAERAVFGINVSHRCVRRLHGALHKAKFYGATQKRGTVETAERDRERPWAKDWVEDANTYVRRKLITQLTNTKHLKKVRDVTIPAILKQHLRDRGIDPDKPGRIPTNAFKGDNAPRMPSGVPIKRVRMKEEGKTLRSVSERRSYQYVKPGNNHHIVYRSVRKRDRETWTADVVTMWEASLRARNGASMIDRSDGDKGRFVMSLSIGEMFEIDGDSGERVLCVVQKLSQANQRLTFKLHIDARPSDDVRKDNLNLSPTKMRERNARKVTVDPLGRIRRAND